MKKLITRILILLTYSIPYVFIAFWYDLSDRSLVGWNIMLLAFLVLMIICIKTKNLIVGIIGNLISFLISYFFTSIQTAEKWEYYFKPFSATGCAEFISVTLAIIQMVVWVVYILHQREKSVEKGNSEVIK